MGLPFTGVDDVLLPIWFNSTYLVSRRIHFKVIRFLVTLLFSLYYNIHFKFTRFECIFHVLVFISKVYVVFSYFYTRYSIKCPFFTRSRCRDVEYGVSRGIDFQLVSNVINFDFPPTPILYVHRVGRTARADQMGTALSFVSKLEESRLADVEALLNPAGAAAAVKSGVASEKSVLLSI